MTHRGGPPRVQSAVLNCLRGNQGRITSLSELVDYVYREDPEGGPLGAGNCVAVAIMKLRRRGFPIRNHPWRGYSYDPTLRGDLIV
jgi:hypothetical protein